jgi:hypothetical protein
MKKIFILFVFSVFLASCTPAKEALYGPAPTLYDNAVVEVTADKILIYPAPPDQTFVKVIAGRLEDMTKKEVENQQYFKVVASCQPRTLKIVQEITGFSSTRITQTRGSFIVAQIFNPGSGTSTTTDTVKINSTTHIVDCDTGKTLNSYEYPAEAPTPIDALQEIANYSVWTAFYYKKAQY